ncbi:zinc finger CCCH domain-containing protein 7B-like isoform X2 [Denticeps clupeoides]|uniref:zinc finger CCCH domain-containing protein 7B-like isoform X2 n=1 Tax=Denticeps clupeoides TaxID=299321 RepID=UPI0010A52FAD|nr:zinc finger CCCH domain-containing protein 7B-like isoform X2 [Denticeps clupeoides]
MDLERQRRREDILKALTFIQLSLPYPEPEGYERFLIQLVCNLLDEGNATFREGECRLARGHYSEAISVAHYAQAEGLTTPPALMETLFVNRAAAHHKLGEPERALQDCDRALALCGGGSGKALYRKALCLRERGQLTEAYDCTTRCLLGAPQDATVNELAQDLANKLGLKNRKAYAGVQDQGRETDGDVSPTSEEVRPTLASSRTLITNMRQFVRAPVGKTVSLQSGLSPTRSGFQAPANGLDSFSDVSSVSMSEYVPHSPSPGVPIPVSDEASPPPAASRKFPDMPPCVPLSVPVSDAMGDCEVMGDELDSLLDNCVLKAEEAGLNPTQGVIPTHLPAAALRPAFPPAQLPPAFFSPAVSHLNSLDSFPGLTSDPRPQPAALDALDVFHVAASAPATLALGGEGLDSLSEFALPGGKVSHKFLPSARTPNSFRTNPLAATHEFVQACAGCYQKNGPGVLDYQYLSDPAHRCKRNVLLVRQKGGGDGVWRRVRPRPMRNNFLGAFVLCKEVQERNECKYGESCTFAYCQEEIDVWTQERKGALNRELLFEPLGCGERQALTVARLLQLHSGMFIFLCEECFDGKPRVISKRCKDHKAVCAAARHGFDINKCLVHVVRTSVVRYCKIRPLHPLCQFDVCRHEVRYGCQRDDSCSFAHSVIELKCWVLQQDSGITHEEMVQESKRLWHRQEQNMHRHKPPPANTGARSSMSPPGGAGGGLRASPGSGGAARGRGLSMKMKFVCGQCWRDGLVSEPDRSLKYCTAKARHGWTKERRVLLVKSFEKKKWVMVRPLPFSRNLPQQYDICVHMLKQKKCHYIGNCSFAHSQEEKDMWTYMKNNGLRDMQQLYDMWLTITNQSHQLPPQPDEEKQITMPTDFAEPLSGFHCRLCGKHSNSERQWQQHISSEKHKDRVFGGEGEEESLAWGHRFPGPHFSLCPRLVGGCSEGLSCDFAHSGEELDEWKERRGFLQRKLAKARADMLIAPTDLDFGKYSFLLQD